MSVSKEFIEYILDQLSKWGGVSVRRMFGGAGLYRDGKIFAIIADDIAYLKVDDTTRGKYVEVGSSPFKPFPNRATIMSYYEVPGEIVENPEEFIEWARESLLIQQKR